MSSASVGRNWSTTPRSPHINGGKGSRACYPPPSVPPYQWEEGFASLVYPPRSPHINGGKVSRDWSTPLGPPISMGGRFSRAWSTPLGPHINGGKVSRAWSTPLGPHINGGKGFRRLGGVSGAEGCSRNLSVSGRASCIAVRSIFPAMTRVSGGGRRMSEVVAVEALENFFCATCEISGSLNGGGADSVVKLHLRLVKHRLGMEGRRFVRVLGNMGQKQAQVSLAKQNAGVLPKRPCFSRELPTPPPSPKHQGGGV